MIVLHYLLPQGGSSCGSMGGESSQLSTLVIRFNIIPANVQEGFKNHPGGCFTSATSNSWRLSWAEHACPNRAEAIVLPTETLVESIVTVYLLDTSLPEPLWLNGHHEWPSMMRPGRVWQPYPRIQDHSIMKYNEHVLLLGSGTCNGWKDSGPNRSQQIYCKLSGPSSHFYIRQCGPLLDQSSHQSLSVFPCKAFTIFCTRIYIYIFNSIYIYTSMERADAVLGSFACCICFRTWHVCLGFKLEWLSGRPRQVLACDLRSSSGMRVNWRFFLTSPGSQHLAFFQDLDAQFFVQLTDSWMFV